LFADWVDDTSRHIYHSCISLLLNVKKDRTTLCRFVSLNEKYPKSPSYSLNESIGHVQLYRNFVALNAT